MKTESEIRAALKDWIARANGKISREALADDIPIFREGVLKSVQVPELILYIEELSERPVEVDKIVPGVFRDIDSIYRSFFANGHA